MVGWNVGDDGIGRLIYLKSSTSSAVRYDAVGLFRWVALQIFEQYLYP